MSDITCCNQVAVYCSYQLAYLFRLGEVGNLHVHLF
uniref:Uncharacterized protein n=1 Tax=Setaria italica TaxID=4555 RepID=K3XUD9_SETIT